MTKARPEVIGRSMLRRRTALNMTQTQCAAALGVYKSTYSMWERGKNFPTADKLPAIAGVLRCQIDDLFQPGEEQV